MRFPAMIKPLPRRSTPFIINQTKRGISSRDASFLVCKVPAGTNCAQIVRPLHVRPNALLYFVRYDRRNSGASRGIRTLDTWFRRPSNENDKLYEIRRIRYRRIFCRSYAVPFSFRGLSGRQLRPTLRPAILFLSHTGAPCLPSLPVMCGRM